jgi:hypothetical protein
VTDPYTRTTEVHQTLWYVLYTEFSTSDMNSEYTKGDGTETKLTVLLLRTFSFLKIYRGYPTSFDLSHHLNPHIIGTQRLDNGLLYRICSIDCPLDCPSLPSSLPSHSQHVEAPRQAVHRIANLSKHPHSARPSLDVLAQPTKRRKLDSAIRLGASVDLVLMTRAFQVLIEMCKRPIRRAAQKALERRPIP